MKCTTLTLHFVLGINASHVNETNKSFPLERTCPVNLSPNVGYTRNGKKCLVDTIQDSNFRFRLKSYVQLRPLIKNDPLFVFVSLTKI